MSFKQVVIDNKKQCTKCFEWKDLESFVVDLRTTSGKTSRCKSCIYTANKNRYNSSEEFRARAKIQRRKSQIKCLYDLSIDTYSKLLEEQNYKCSICLASIESALGIDKKKNPANIDHCHKTGKVRGLLCNHCNRGLGSFKDNEESLMNAIEYLRKYKR